MSNHTGIKVVTYFSTLMKYAKEEAEARKSGNDDRIKEAEAKHKEYQQLCLKADSMIIPNVRHIV